MWGRKCNSDNISSNKTAIEHSHDIDGIALTVVEQILEQMLEYENTAVSHINEHDFKQVELNIQAKRIEHILDLCLKKIELALLLPWIFRSDAQIGENKKIQEHWSHIYERIQSVSKARHNYSKESLHGKIVIFAGTRRHQRNSCRIIQLH